MSKDSHSPWRHTEKPVIGMLHLAPLPLSPGYGGDLERVRERLLEDAVALRDGGVDALMLENFGDTPFLPGAAHPVALTHMTALAREALAECRLPLGVNVLRNDGCGALAVAHAVGADFIRVNVLCGARLCDQGILQGIAHELLRLRRQLDAEEIAIFADVDVKHSAPLAAIAIEDEVADLIHRGGADALIVSGSGTGKPADREKLRQVKAAAGTTPVLIGSGVHESQLESLAPLADGFIVGTAFKRNGQTREPVDPGRVTDFMKRLKNLRG